MRRLIFAPLLFVAFPLFAGLTYRFEVKSTGAGANTLSGRVEADGARMRMDVAHGDPILFKDNSIVLSSDGGKTMTVLDPATKTYFVINLSDFIGGPNNQLKQLGATMKFENAKVDVHDGGSGGTIEGFPTQKSTLDASWDIAVDMMGQSMKMHVKVSTDTWRTDKLNGVITPFQAQGLRTGVEALDRIIEASANMKGFPLREVTTIDTTQGTNVIHVSNTSTVTDVQQRDVAASEFAMPAGYTKVQNPIDRMLGAIRH
jgi:hypothetical protein